MQITALLSVAAVSALAMAASHYIARTFFPGTEPGKEWGFPRLVAYIVGVLGISAPVTIYLFEHDMADGAIVLWTAIGAAGLSTLLCYLADNWWIGRLRKREDDEMDELKGKQYDQTKR